MNKFAKFLEKQSRLVTAGTVALAAIAVTYGLLLIPSAPQARAQSGQGWPTTQFPLSLTSASGTNIASGTVPISGTSAITSQAFAPNAITGFAVVPVISGTSSVVSGSLTFNFQVSLDGTNWTTGYPVAVTVANNGTNSVTGFYNVPPATSGSAGVANAPWLRLGEVINTGTLGTITITGVTIVVSNHP